MATVIIAAIVTVIGVVAFSQIRFDPVSIDNQWQGTPLPPCFADVAKCYGHVLGTDEIGRDELARLVYGGIVSLGFAVFAVVVELVLGAGIAISARRGGPIVQFIVQRFEAALSCFPPWLFVLTMIVIGRPPHAETISMFAIAALTGLVFSPRIARIAITVREQKRALFSVFDQAANDLARAVALLATVDFFGIGIQPPMPSWGSMIQNSEENITIAWWAAVFPAVALFCSMLLIELLRRLFFDDAAPAAVESGPSLV